MVRTRTVIGVAVGGIVAAAAYVKIVKSNAVIVDDMKWSVDENTQHHVRYLHEGHVVDVSMLDTGEWVIYYGEDEATRLYTRNLFSRSSAVAEAKACIRDYTTELVTGTPVPGS